MGDRVSVQFVNDGEKSIVLFDHWGGKEFPQAALEYAKELKLEMGDNQSYPLSRLEPRVVMVDFIRWLWINKYLIGKKYNDKMEYIETGRINGSYYFGVDENDGDNSDNGHWIINLKTLEMEHIKGEFEPDEDGE